MYNRRRVQIGTAQILVVHWFEVRNLAREEAELVHRWLEFNLTDLLYRLFIMLGFAQIHHDPSVFQTNVEDVHNCVRRTDSRGVYEQRAYRLTSVDYLREQLSGVNCEVL